MSQSAHQGLEGRNDLVDRPLSTSSNRPLQEKSDSEDEELIGKMAELECLSEDLKGFIAFGCLMAVVVAIPLSVSISLVFPRPDCANPNTWPILDRPFSFKLATALITALLIGLSLRRPKFAPYGYLRDRDRPTQHDAWYQVTLCLYFAALVKLLLDVDLGSFLAVHWWNGFLLVSWHHLARSRAIVRTMRKHFLY